MITSSKQTLYYNHHNTLYQMIFYAIPGRRMKYDNEII